MSQLVSQLSPAMRAFFEAFFLGNAETPNLAALYAQVGPELEITVGRYRPYAGVASSVAGHLFLPAYAIHVEREQVFFSGTDRRLTFYQRSDSPPPSVPPAVPVPSGGAPAPGAPPAAPLVGLQPYQYSLVRVDQRVDPITDSRDEMALLLVGLGARPQAGGGVDRAIAGAWADAIVAARQQDEATFTTSLEMLTEVPAALPTTDLAAYKRIMYQLGTYLADGRGTHYCKRDQSVMGEGGLPFAFPEGTTIEYRRINTRELRLEANRTYCLVNVPDGWGSGVDRQAGQFREIVFLLTSVPGGGVELSPVSWATRLIRYGDAPARDFFDFCFFITETQVADVPAPLPDELPPEPPV